MEVPPKIEEPVCEPKGVVVVLTPKGLGAKGLLLALLLCPKTDGDPNGLLDDCPKAVVTNFNPITKFHNKVSNTNFQNNFK